MDEPHKTISTDISEAEEMLIEDEGSDHLIYNQASEEALDRYAINELMLQYTTTLTGLIKNYRC